MYNFYILKLRVLRVIFLWGLLGMMCMIRIPFIFIGFVSLTIMTGSKNILSRNCRWMLGKCSCWLGRLRKIRIGVWHVLGIVSGILGLSTLQSTLYLVICIIILFIDHFRPVNLKVIHIRLIYHLLLSILSNFHIYLYFLYKNLMTHIHYLLYFTNVYNNTAITKICRASTQLTHFVATFPSSKYCQHFFKPHSKSTLSPQSTHLWLSLTQQHPYN